MRSEAWIRQRLHREYRHQSEHAYGNPISCALLRAALQQVVLIAFDSHHKRQQIRSRSMPCRHPHRPLWADIRPCRPLARRTMTKHPNFSRSRPCPFAAPFVDANCTRSFPWPRPRSMRWSSAANFRAASDSPHAVSSGIWKRSRPGSRRERKPRDQRRSVHLPARTSGGANTGPYDDHCRPRPCLTCGPECQPISRESLVPRFRRIWGSRACTSMMR